MEALAEHLRELPAEERDTLARVVFTVLTPQVARLVPLAANKHGLSSGA